MNVTFKNDGWIARFYKTSYRYEFREGILPNNLCDYWWKLVRITICLPLTWWTYFYNGDDFKDFTDRIFPAIIINFLVALAECGGYGIALNIFNQGGVWAIIYATPCIVGFLLIILIGFAIAAGITMGITKLSDWWFKKPHVNVVKPNGLLISYIKAKKAKLCPMITWVSSDKH